MYDRARGANVPTLDDAESLLHLAALVAVARAGPIGRTKERAAERSSMATVHERAAGAPVVIVIQLASSSCSSTVLDLYLILLQCSGWWLVDCGRVRRATIGPQMKHFGSL